MGARFRQTFRQCHFTKKTIDITNILVISMTFYIQKNRPKAVLINLPKAARAQLREPV